MAPEADTCAGEVEQTDTYAYRELDGVDPDLLSLDVYSAAAPVGCPVVMWVHGGAWQTGDKATPATRVKAEHFVGEGYVFVSLNYRLVTDDNAVRWPAFGDDVAAATAWVIDHADTIGGDPDRVALLGHSAGAHLVSIVGTNPDLLGGFDATRDELRCVVALDTLAFDLDAPDQAGRDIVQLAFDADPAALFDGSPIDQALEHVGNGPTGAFLVVVRGRPARVDASEEFVRTLTSIGTEATLVDVNPYTHRDVNVLLGEPGEELVTAPVTEFLADCLA